MSSQHLLSNALGRNASKPNSCGSGVSSLRFTLGKESLLVSLQVSRTNDGGH
jgi:hypothetical protein